MDLAKLAASQDDALPGSKILGSIYVARTLGFWKPDLGFGFGDCLQRMYGGHLNHREVERWHCLTARGSALFGSALTATNSACDALGLRENFWLNGRQDELRLTLQYVPDQPTTDVDDRIASTPVLSDAEIDAFRLAHSNLQTSSHTRARSTVLAANQGNVVLSGFEHVSFYDQLFDGPYATAGDTGNLYQLLAEKMAARNPAPAGPGDPCCLYLPWPIPRP